jgi:hypothetical protein
MVRCLNPLTPSSARFCTLPLLKRVGPNSSSSRCKPSDDIAAIPVVHGLPVDADDLPQLKRTEHGLRIAQKFYCFGPTQPKEPKDMASQNGFNGATASQSAVRRASSGGQMPQRKFANQKALIDYAKHRGRRGRRGSLGAAQGPIPDQRWEEPSIFRSTARRSFVLTFPHRTLTNHRVFQFPVFRHLLTIVRPLIVTAINVQNSFHRDVGILDINPAPLIGVALDRFLI